MTTSSEQHDLRDVFDRTVADLDVPVTRLVAGATRDGRRLRRRRRVGTAALAVAAGVAALATYAPGDDGGPDSVGAASDPGGLEKSTDFGPPQGWWDMPADEMLDRLRPLLPEDVRVVDFDLAPDDRLPGDPDVYPGVLGLTLSGPAGPGSAELMFQHLEDDAVAIEVETSADPSGDLTAEARPLGAWRRSQLRCPVPDLEPQVRVMQCTELPAEDGHGRARVLVTSYEGVVHREVRMGLGDTLLYVATANSVEDKWTAPASATEPPLGVDELVALATADAWTSWRP